MDIASYVSVALVSYLAGSVPTGYLAGRLRGVDIRTTGSGNIGATNAFRVLGKTAGAIVLAVDVFKGFAACRGAPMLLGDPSSENLRIAAGISAILGHNYSCWLKFRGGKGIATSAGVLLGWLPVSLAWSVGLWTVVLAISRYVSLASIVAAVALPFAAWLSGGSRTMIIIGAILGGLAVFKHRSNIRRLMNGTERRIGAKAGRSLVASL